MKLYPYVIELKRPSYRLIDFISQLLFLISLSAFTYALFIGLPVNIIAIYLSSGGIIGWWIFCIWKTKNDQIPYYRLGLIVACLGWWYLPKGGWICAIYLLASFFEKQAKFPEELAFDQDEIVVNNFPKKHIFWEDLNNVIIKDGLLTIDFKNNKLLQKEIQSGSNIKDEQDFNEFCRNRLQQKD
jgi:hypothetical protein